MQTCFNFMNMIHFTMIATDVTNEQLLHEAPKSLPRWTNVNIAGPQDIFDVTNAFCARNEINLQKCFVRVLIAGVEEFNNNPWLARSIYLPHSVHCAESCEIIRNSQNSFENCFERSFVNKF